jgi:hypothetical protein
MPSFRVTERLYADTSKAVAELQRLGGSITYYPVEEKHQCFGPGYKPVSDFLYCPLEAARQAIANLKKEN